MGNMNKTMYAAKLSYGSASLIKITIVKETKHTISVSDKEILIGSKYSQHFGYKDGLNLFDTLDEAIEYLIKKLQDANNDHQQGIAENSQVMCKLEAMNG